MKHKYRVTVEDISSGNTTEERIQFEAENHDDVFAIIQKMQGNTNFNEEDATAFAVGLKLFSEVMLKNRTAPLFSSFLPHFGAFMQELKGSIKK